MSVWNKNVRYTIETVPCSRGDVGLEKIKFTVKTNNRYARARRITYRRPRPKQIIIIIIIVVLDGFNRTIGQHARIRSRRANSSESCRGREHREWWSPINIYSSSQPPRCARKNTHVRHGASSMVYPSHVPFPVPYSFIFHFQRQNPRIHVSFLPEGEDNGGWVRRTRVCFAPKTFAFRAVTTPI